MIVVSDTSPITNLLAIQQIHILRQIYGELIIPQAVYSEMVEQQALSQRLVKAWDLARQAASLLKKTRAAKPTGGFRDSVD